GRRVTSYVTRPRSSLAEYRRNKITARVVTRSVGKCDVARQAWLDLVSGEYVGHFNGVGHRLNPISLNLREQVDVTDNLGELPSHGIEFGVRKLKPGEVRYFFDIGAR